MVSEVYNCSKWWANNNWCPETSVMGGRVDLVTSQHKSVQNKKGGLQQFKTQSISIGLTDSLLKEVRASYAGIL